jgi:DNA-binding NarL/FixJ family response regulator
VVPFYVIEIKWPDIHIIGLSMYMEGDQAAAMIASGAAKYLTKSGPGEALIEAIRACVRVPEDKAAKRSELKSATQMTS